MNYDRYVQSIRAYERNSVLFSVAEGCWTTWNREDDPNLTEIQKRQIILYRAYAPRVACISAATGNRHRNKISSPADILRLSRLHLEVNEGISDTDFTAAEVDRALTSFAAQPILAQYQFDREALRLAVRVLFIQRLLRSQWDAPSFSLRHVARSWLHLRSLLANLGEPLKRALELVFNQDPLHAMRSAIGLYVMFEDRPPVRIPGL